MPTTGGVGAAVLRVPPILRRFRMCRARNGSSRLPTCGVCPWTTGASRPARPRTGTEPRSRSGDVAYDDGFDKVPDGPTFALAGGDRRIEVTFEKGYPAAQLFAPPGEDLVAHRADGGTDGCAAPRRTTAARPRGSPGRAASRSRWCEDPRRRGQGLSDPAAMMGSWLRRRTPVARETLSLSGLRCCSRSWRSWPVSATRSTGASWRSWRRSSTTAYGAPRVRGRWRRWWPGSWARHRPTRTPSPPSRTGSRSFPAARQGMREGRLSLDQVGVIAERRRAGLR